MLEKLLLDGVAVEAGDCAKPPGNLARARPRSSRSRPKNSMSAAPCLEEVDVVLLAPSCELAKVERVSLAGEPAVTGKESGESDPLGIAKH